MADRYFSAMIVILNNYGTSLRAKDGAFLIKSKDGSQKISPDKVQSILIHKGCSLSSDAAILAVQHMVDVVFMSRGGQAEARLWTHRFGSISEIRIRQLSFVRSSAALVFMRNVLMERLDGQMHLLRQIAHDRPSLKNEINTALLVIKDFRNKISGEDVLQWDKNILSRFRGLEGSAARAYFQCVGKILPEKYKFEKRSRRPARDIFNAMLNYLYGILYSRCESALVRAGVDPYLGLMHRNEYKRPVLAFDIIERYRIWAEAVSVQLCFRLIPEEYMFSFEKEGYWLEASGKKILINAFELYMDEITQRNGKRRSRNRHIIEDAQVLAASIMNGNNILDNE